MKKKIKDLTKLEAEKYFCNKHRVCRNCLLDRKVGCKMDVYNKDYDEEEVEIPD